MLSAGLRAVAGRGAASTPSAIKICSASLYYTPEEPHRAVSGRLSALCSAPARAHCVPATQVVNQTPPLENYNVYRNDPALQEAVARHGGGWAEAHLHKVGDVAGSAAFLNLGRLANENKPVFLSHDRFGNRQDVVEFHPAYHQVMETGIQLQVRL